MGLFTDSSGTVGKYSQTPQVQVDPTTTMVLFSRNKHLEPEPDADPVLLGFNSGCLVSVNTCARPGPVCADTVRTKRNVRG